MSVLQHEIEAVKFVQNGSEYITDSYGLSLTLFMDSFLQYKENSIAVRVFPIKEMKNLVLDYVRSRPKNQDTKIFFDNIYEGNTISCFHAIHEVIKGLKLNVKNCYFISGAVQAREFYEQFCINYKIVDKINILVFNYWERHAQQTFNGNKRSNFNPQFLIKNKEKLFLCFNRITRPHRTALLGLLFEKKLVDNSFYSYFHKMSYTNFSWKPVQERLTDDLFTVIYENITNNENKFPLLLNNLNGENTNEVLQSDKEYYENSYFSLVTETFFFKHVGVDPLMFEELSVFFSEKTFKPILCKHPFILVSRPKTLEFLKKLGYRTFHPFINENYDLIENDIDRLNFIVEEVERLSKKTNEEWLEWQENVKQIVEYNFNVITQKTDFIWNQ